MLPIGSSGTQVMSNIYEKSKIAVNEMADYD